LGRDGHAATLNASDLLVPDDAGVFAARPNHVVLRFVIERNVQLLCDATSVIARPSLVEGGHPHPAQVILKTLMLSRGLETMFMVDRIR
jgi:hypothetical protein